MQCSRYPRTCFLLVVTHDIPMAKVSKTVITDIVLARHMIGLTTIRGGL